MLLHHAIPKLRRLAVIVGLAVSLAGCQSPPNPRSASDTPDTFTAHNDNCQTVAGSDPNAFISCMARAEYGIENPTPILPAAHPTTANADTAPPRDTFRREINQCARQSAKLAASDPTAARNFQAQCLQKVRDQMRQHQQQQSAVNRARAESLPGVEGEVIRRMNAAQNAYQTGDQARSGQLFTSMAEDAPRLLSEADQAGLISTDRGIYLQIARAQIEAGYYQDQIGNHRTAVQFYESAMNTLRRYGLSYPEPAVMLGFHYASGSGVPRNKAQADEYFSIYDNEQTRVFRALLNHNMLPSSPDEVTQPLIDRINQIMGEEFARAVDAYLAAWHRDHPEQRSETTSSGPSSYYCHNAPGFLKGMAGCSPWSW